MYGNSNSELLKNSFKPPLILFIFIDGLGIGENDPTKNPCASPGIKFFNNFLSDTYPKPLPHNGLAIGVDATMGVEGLPQSATGQTALLTGINAAAALGRHLNGFPNEALRKILAKDSILKYFSQNGYRAAFINTFRPPFFDYNPFDIVRHLSATSVANLFADLPFFNLDDLKAERSIYQEFTNQHLRDKGFNVPQFTPRKAGEILAQQSIKYDFCLFEYFQTDIAGHSRNMKFALKEINKLEQFLDALLTNISLEQTLVVLASDHGNIEDISVKGHTRNPAMTMIWGPQNKRLASKLAQITDIAPAVISIGLGKNYKVRNSSGQFYYKLV